MAIGDSLSTAGICFTACRYFTPNLIHTKNKWNHINARESYAGLPRRLYVPDEKVDWSIPWDDYDLRKNVEPTYYDGKSFIRSDRISDRIKIDPNTLKEAAADGKMRLADGRVYHLLSFREGDFWIQKNPYGRTGSEGRGVLKEWGGNKALDPVVTRQARKNPNVRQVLVCRNLSDDEWGNKWHLPGARLTDSDTSDSALPNKNFILKFLKAIIQRDHAGRSDVEQVLEMLENLFLSERNKIFPNNEYKIGYCDDPRNTDDAWIETEVYAFHIPENIGNLLENLEVTKDIFRDQISDAVGAAILDQQIKKSFWWMTIDESCMEFRESQNGIQASHKFFIELCMPYCKCGLREYDNSNDSHRFSRPKFETALESMEHMQRLTSCYVKHPLIGDAFVADVKFLSALDVLQTVSFESIFDPYPAPESGQACSKLQFAGSLRVASHLRARVDNEQDALLVCRELFGNRSKIAHDENWIYDKVQSLWRPRAVISVTGGAQNFRLAADEAVHRSKVAEIFSQGIVKAAKAMKAMVVDGGFAAGIMREVGLAMKDEDQITTLGVSPWGAILQKEKLSEVHVGTSDCIECSKDSDGHGKLCGKKGLTTYTTQLSNSKHGARLDPNHDFFVFVDSGRSGGPASFGTEISGRARIENVLAGSSNESKFAPHVLVVVSGGPGSIKSAYELSFTRHLSIVVVQGTGGAADLIASTWLHFHSDVGEGRQCCDGSGACDQKVQCVNSVPSMRFEDAGQAKDKDTNHAVKSDLEKGPMCWINSETICCNHLHGLFLKHMPADTNLDKYENSLLMSMVVSICRDKNRVSVYDFKSTFSLSHCIMASICRYQREQGVPSRSLMEMCMQWNTEDAVKVALSQILQSEIKGYSFRVDKRVLSSKGKEKVLGQSMSDADKRAALVSALRANNHAFVELLHDFGITVNYSDIWSAGCSESSKPCLGINCRKCANQSSSFIAHEEMNSIPENTQFSGSGLLLQRVSSKLGKKEISNVGSNDFDRYIERLTGWKRMSSVMVECKSSQGAVDMSSYELTEELFLWSVLTGNKEIAEIYWLNCHPSSQQHCLSRALFACAVSRRILEQPGMDQNKRRIFSGVADHFEQIATDIMGNIYARSRGQTIKALTCLWLQPWLNSRSTWCDTSGWHHSKFLSPIELAHAAKASKFVAHDAFQMCISQLWCGKLVNEFPAKSDLEGCCRGMLIQFPKNPLRRVLGPNILLEHLMFIIFAVLPPLIIFLPSYNPGAEVEAKQCTCVQKLRMFYTAPVTKFTLQFMFYVAFVLIYTYVGFFMDHTYGGLEKAMHVWMFCMVFAEIRQIMYDGWRAWWRMNIKKFSLLALLIYIPAFALRMIEVFSFDTVRFNALGANYSSPKASLVDDHPAMYAHVGDDFTVARSWHGVAGIFFWLRIFFAFRWNASLGPLWLVLVDVTMNDVLHFFIFLIVILTSFGAAIICAARPRQDPNISFASYMEDSVFFPYMEMFVEHFMDSFLFSSHPQQDDQPDVYHRRLGTILQCVCILITSVVLTNLLIAGELFCVAHECDHCEPVLSLQQFEIQRHFR